MMTTTKLNPKMITVARESRGFSQLELAEKLSLSPSNLSRMEQDFIEVGENHLKSISTILNYPVEFFYQEGETLPPALALRKRNVVAQKIMLPIEAQVNIYRLNVEKLLKAIGQPEINLPVLDIEKLGSPAEAARKLRLSQPALTIAIAKLEEELGITLVVKGERPLRFTPAGKAVYQTGLKQQAVMESLKAELKHSLHEKPEVRLGMVDTVAAMLLSSPSVLDTFSDITNLSLTVNNSRYLQNQVGEH